MAFIQNDDAVRRLQKVGLLDAARVLKVLEIDVPADTVTTEVSTGTFLPSQCAVVDVLLRVDTIDATETLDVGTDGSGSNDPDGFLVGASVATAGIVKGTLASGGQTKGALLRADETGSGGLVPELDVTSGGEEITFTRSAGSDTFVGKIFVFYYDLTGDATVV